MGLSDAFLSRKTVNEVALKKALDIYNKYITLILSVLKIKKDIDHNMWLTNRIVENYS